MSDTDPGSESPRLTRRGFLRKGAAAAAGGAAVAAALSPLRDLAPDDIPTIERLFQKHYKEMTPADKERIFARIEREVKARHGVKTRLTDPPPLDGVEYVYALNISRCIGCRKCVHACVAENNTARAPEIQYIRVLQMPKGSQNVESSDHTTTRRWCRSRTATTCPCSATSVPSRRA